jgi:5'-nucleotidase
MTSKIRIYIDMDDTLCNYSKAKAEQIIPGKLEYPQCQYGFFANLEPIFAVEQCVPVLIKHFDVWILTAPSVKNPLSYAEKRVWIERYFGLEMCEKLIICSNKALLKGDYLIDDSCHNGQPEFEGKWLQFGSSEFKDWYHIFNYIDSKELK